ncbi:MAG TPA: response regulator transcription factor [Chitinophagales bacterium]|nr:response regulator transcription factor [Chitinophagales bacterium]
METPITVAIVEDTEIIRESLSMLIRGTEGFDCVAVYANAEDALQELPAICPDVVLMDIGLPGISGIECVRRLRMECPNTQYLMCTIFEDDENIFEALKAGATGYILKKTSPAMKLDAIIELHNGGAPMSGQIARRVIQAMQQPKANDALASLTDRETEILRLLSKGFRYKEISDQLNISTATVRTHIHNIYEKLHVQSRTDALNKVFPR